MSLPPWPRGSKKRARELCQTIARECPDGPVTGEYGIFLAWLLARHPDAAQKTGPGIACITVGTVPGHPNTRGFTVHRTDGSSTDFSWPECITETPHRTRVLTAMREAVAGQVIAFKQAESDAGRLHCAVTGAELTWDDAEVDHMPPGFGAIADAFATAAGGYDKISLVHSADGMIGRPMKPAFETVWVWYHHQQARLRILSRAAHRKLTREQQQQKRKADGT